MKKIAKLIVLFLLLTCLCACGASKAKGPKEPTTKQLDAAVSNCKYTYGGMFSTTIAKLVNAGMTDYNLKYYTRTEAVEKGIIQPKEYVPDEDFDGSIYVAVISGDVTPNVSVPAYTVFENYAVKALLVFDKDGELTSAHTIDVCGNLNAVFLQSLTN